MNSPEWRARKGDDDDEWYVDGTTQFVDGSMSREDAHIFAAGREMLEALKRAEPVLLDFGGGYAHTLVVEAIAKAEGREA